MTPADNLGLIAVEVTPSPRRNGKSTICHGNDEDVVLDTLDSHNFQ